MTPPRTRSRRSRMQAPAFEDRRRSMLDSQEGNLKPPTPVRLIRRMWAQTAYYESEAPIYIAPPTPLLKQAFRCFIGLFILLPLSVVMIYALMQQLYHSGSVVGDISFWQSVPVWYTILGILVFATLKGFGLVDAILMFLYVAGHELTHALTAMMCFGKVEHVCVDLDGGYVDTDTDNLFVSLSPYFVPLWMLVWMAVFYVVNLIWPFDAYMAWFCAGFGFWWAFHIYWTLWILPREQPDLLENGVVLSFMIIMVANVLSLLVILRCFGVVSLRGYGQDFVNCAVEIYTTYRDLIVWLLQFI